MPETSRAAGLAAWHMERADLMAAIEQTAEAGVGTAGPAVWTPRCRCGEPAVHRIVYVWENDGAAERDVCDVHYHSALDAYEALRRSAPDAVADLRVLVAG